MKDSADKHTKDLLGAKRRGRPSMPAAKSAAQRMRELRQRQAFVTFDLHDVAQRKKDKCYSTYGEAFEDLLGDLICDENLPAWFAERFPDLVAPDA